MNNEKVVINALSYLDSNLEKYEYLFKDVTYISFNQTVKNDMEKRKLTFYDINKKKVFESKFEVFGIYDDNVGVWTWAWSYPNLYKNVTYLSRKTLEYGLDIDYNENNLLKSELITSRFKINDKLQLEIHSALAAYITKVPVIFKYSYAADINEIDENDIIKLNKDTKNTLIYYLFILDYDQ